VNGARAENQLGLVLVVAPATQRDVLDGGRSPVRIRLRVVELQERALRASHSVWGDEGALAIVPLPDRTLSRPAYPSRDG